MERIPTPPSTISKHNEETAAATTTTATATINTKGKTSRGASCHQHPGRPARSREARTDPQAGWRITVHPSPPEASLINQQTDLRPKKEREGEKELSTKNDPWEPKTIHHKTTSPAPTTLL
jgi:hypothetical protein